MKICCERRIQNITREFHLSAKKLVAYNVRPYYETFITLYDQFNVENNLSYTSDLLSILISTMNNIRGKIYLGWHTLRTREHYIRE